MSDDRRLGAEAATRPLFVGAGLGSQGGERS